MDGDAGRPWARENGSMNLTRRRILASLPADLSLPSAAAEDRSGPALGQPNVWVWPVQVSPHLPVASACKWPA
jgi:hypothetical protein